MNKISFSTAQLNRLFPFYLTVDMELTVTSAGDAVDRIFGGVRGYKLNEIFKLDELHVLSASFLKEVIGENIELYYANNLSLYLKAEVDYIEDTNEFFIIGNPQLIKIDKEISQPPVGVNKDLHIGEKSQKYYQTYSGDITENAKEILNCILITDKEGKIEWVNRAFERTTGYNIEHVIGKRPRQILYGQRSIYVTPSYVDDSVVKERPFSFQNIGYTSQNQAFWFEALVYPIFDKEHSISGRISRFQDITKRKRAANRGKPATMAFCNGEKRAWCF
jgi:PAS domain S-box-containing protein